VIVMAKHAVELDARVITVCAREKMRSLGRGPLDAEYGGPCQWRVFAAADRSRRAPM
jgi:hypothetical protein